MAYLGSSVLLMLLSGVSVAHTLEVPAQQSANTSGEVVSQVALDGPTLFRERGCQQCHAIHGTGGHKGPELSGIGRRKKKDAIRQQIVMGGGAMPAYGEVLTAEETATLVRYLQHCRDQ